MEDTNDSIKLLSSYPESDKTGKCKESNEYDIEQSSSVTTSLNNFKDIAKYVTINDIKQKDFNRKFYAMAVGNALEFYDFSVFGSVADIIGENFFPTSNNNMRFLQSLSVFGAAFLMRPLGGILMGKLGDTKGRKIALEYSVLIMLITSLLIGCLPDYHSIGYIGTILLIIFRLCQGFAVGGELVGAFIYTLEAAEGKNRGFWGASCKASGFIGSGLGMVIIFYIISF